MTDSLGDGLCSYFFVSAMAPSIKNLAIRLFLTCVRIADRICRLFGYKIFQVTHKSVLSGLTTEEAAEAMDPSIVTPLNISLEAARDTPEFDAVARMVFIARTQFLLKIRAGTKRALEPHPEVLQVFTL